MIIKLTREQIDELEDNNIIEISKDEFLVNHNNELYYATTEDIAIFYSKLDKAHIADFQNDGAMIIKVDETKRVIFRDDKLSEEDIKKLNQPHKTKIINNKENEALIAQAKSNIFFAKQLTMWLILVIAIVLFAGICTIIWFSKQLSNSFVRVVSIISIIINSLLLVYEIRFIKRNTRYIKELEEDRHKYE